MRLSQGLGGHEMTVITIDSGNAIDVLSDELVNRWSARFLQETWPARLELLQQVHDQLKDDLKDMALYCAISPVLVQKFIERLPAEPIASVPQAQIYANSASDEHRRLAGQWLRAHQGASFDTVL